jgi:CHAD domain-containing protein
VHLAHLAAYRRRIKPYQQATLTHYQQHLGKLHETAHRQLIGALSSDDYVGLVADFRELLAASVRPDQASPLRVEEVAKQSVTPLLERVWRRGRDISDASPDKQLHRLRIDVKRLRYQLEFLQGAYGGELDAAVDQLKKLQERLGLLQDACVARAHLARFRKLHAVDQGERSLFKRLIRREKQRARHQRQRFPGDWQRFEESSAELPSRL